MSRTNGPPFHISWPAAQLVAVTALLHRARAVGSFAELVADFDELERRLSLDPTGWGDPQFDYHHLGLTVYHALLSLVQVYYAVDKKRRIVYLKEILPMPGRALED